MRRFLPILLAATLAASAVHAQPSGGDVVVTALRTASPFGQGLTLYFDPTRTNPALSTLATNVVPNSFGNAVAMGSNNRDVVVAEGDGLLFSGTLVRIDPSGKGSTIAYLADSIDGFALDGDGLWITAGVDLPGFANSLHTIDDVTGAATTLLSVPTQGRFHYFNEIAIYRESYTYAVPFYTPLTVLLPRIIGTDRKGVLTTIYQGAGDPLLALNDVEVDPRTGDLLTADSRGPGSQPPEQGGVELNRVSQSGTVTTLLAFTGANAIHVNQDDTLYAAGLAAGASAVLRYDLAARAVITIYRFPGLPLSAWALSGITVYGSRILTANGQGGPGRTIRIAVRCHNPSAPGGSYQLAASFGRRPGIRFPNGEWLHLNVADPLFLLTALNQLPGVMRNFAGRLDATGAAAASITLPAGFPAGLGVTVFVSGIVFDRNGLIASMNTHWFEL